MIATSKLLKSVLIISFLSVYTLIGQTDTKSKLKQALINDITILHGRDTLPNGLRIDSLIHEKIEQAEIYLQERLDCLILVDSSTLYERTKAELDSLESTFIAKESGQTDIDYSVFTSLEKKYFFLSMLKPYKSKDILLKLINYYAYDLQYRMDRGNALTTGFLNVIWYYELLESRFKNETLNFTKKKLGYYYNNAYEFSRESYINF